MILRYAALLTVTVRHGYYTDGGTSDFVIMPAPRTRRALAQAGLVYRPKPDGFRLYAEVDPASDPPALLRPLGDDALVFTFILRLANPHVLGITEGTEFAMGDDVLYFDNLRDDQADDRFHLGDSVAGVRIGSPLRLLTQRTFEYALPAPVTNAVVTVDDRFDNEVLVETVDVEEPVDVHVLDFAAAGLAPGRYRVSDDQGGAQDLYYDPDLFGQRAFGVVQLFSRTDTLTADSSDLVPPDYRFLDGDTLAAGGDYTIQFEPRATTRRYVVVKQYDTNTVDLIGLAITGGTFTRTIDGDRAIFDSDTAVVLDEAGQDYDLEHEGTKIMDLPNPRPGTPLQVGSGPSLYTSELYVYV